MTSERNPTPSPPSQTDRTPWARISVLGPHLFHVAWGIGFMRNGFASRLTARSATRLRDRKLAAMKIRAAKIRDAEASIR